MPAKAMEGVDDAEEAMDAAPAPAAPAPAAPTPAAPGENEYTSSKSSGEALSGQDISQDDGMPENVETLGEQKKKKEGLSHAKTFMIGVAAGGGWGMTVAGDLYCGEFSSSSDDSDGRKSVCTAGTPAFLDITAGFGASPRIDIVMTVRMNLQKRDYDYSDCDSDTVPCDEGKGLFNNKIGVGFFPGVRLWGKDNDKVFKVGGAIDFMYMRENFSGYRDRPQNPREDADAENIRNEQRVGDHSIGLRGGPIIQIDPHHNFGIYILPAVVPKFHVDGPAWFEIGFEGSIGVQARFP